MPAITVPKEYAFVLASLLANSYLLLGLGSLVSRTRKAAGIKYPQMYAEKAEVDANKAALKFNCAQRAHNNTLEQTPVFFLASLIAGLHYPVPVAAAGIVRFFGRIMYARGYLRSPSQRGNGFHVLGELGYYSILLASTYTTFNLVLAAL